MLFKLNEFQIKFKLNKLFKFEISIQIVDNGVISC